VNQDQTFAIILILLCSTIFMVARALKGPLGQALARRLTGAVPDLPHDAEIAELRARLTELEERLDFTERVLLQQQERPQVPAGGEHP
jgi:hypothetical protein